jgi:hypothetical protein
MHNIYHNFVGFINDDIRSHPLIKIDSEIVISILGYTRTQSEILTSAEISASPAYSVYSNRCSRWEDSSTRSSSSATSSSSSPSDDFFDLYLGLLVTFPLVLLLPQVLRLAILRIRPVPLALVLLVKLNHMWQSIVVIKSESCSVPTEKYCIITQQVQVNLKKLSRICQLRTEILAAALIHVVLNLSNSLTYTASSKVPHAIFPEINYFCIQVIFYNRTEKLQWIQKVWRPVRSTTKNPAKLSLFSSCHQHYTWKTVSYTVYINLIIY